MPWILSHMGFYLFAVGLQEVFIFRGCVEEGLAQFGPWAGAIVAGLFFGLAHAPLALLQGGLAFPMLVHGLLDFLGAR